ncbi:MAG: hypothetical protein LQ347_006474 [Umbilicaria vellea]|nr:MAG: hypothetical protein LQ347_006474 [Umbilicaria vellea]
MVDEKNIHEGDNFHYDHQGQRRQAKSFKGVSRANGTSSSVACDFVAKVWDGEPMVLLNVLEESAALGNEDGCRKIWLHEDGTTLPVEPQPSKADKAAAERKVMKESKKAGDARRKEKRN